MTGGGAARADHRDTGAGREGGTGWSGGSWSWRRVAVRGTAGPGGELWFVIAGTGRLEPGTGPAIPVRRDTGVWLPPGARYRLSADGPGELTLDSVSSARRGRGEWRRCHPAAAVRAA
jgi:hypothetical protein